MFDLFKKRNRSAKAISEYLLNYYTKPFPPPPSATEMRETEEVEESLFDMVANNTELTAAFPGDVDSKSEIKRIYKALIYAGAGQVTPKGLVPFLAINDRACIEYLHNNLDEYDENTPIQEESVCEAAWRVLRYFKDNEPLP